MVLVVLFFNQYKYENVCLSVCRFLGRLKIDWDTIWQKVAFWTRKGFNTKIYLIGALINKIISVN